jgi:NADH pyrophosphatase NudC (nudix superfamily)
LKVDENELEEAKWFSLDEIELIIKNQHPQSVFIPPSRAIANKLINYWYENKSKL